MAWQDFLEGIRQRRQEHATEKAAARLRERRVQEAIEHVVDVIDPRIRGIQGYRKKLGPSVERSINWVATLVRKLPPGIEVSSQSWGRDPRVKALFAGKEDLQRIYSHTPEVQAFFSEHPGADYCHALLSMERRERTVLGMELDGDILRRDVKQIAVSFTDHRVVKPSETEEQLRDILEQRGFENLVAYALERITELLASKASLEEQRHLLDLQLRVARQKHEGLVPLISGDAATSIDLGALREQAARNAKELDEAHAALATLDDYVARLVDVLGNPEQHLRLQPVSMRLNGMNIRLDGQSGEAGHELHLCEALLGEHLRRILLLTRFPRQDLLPPETELF